MAKWQRTLRLQPEWGLYGEDEISVQELAAAIGKKIAAIRPLSDRAVDDERKEIAEEFAGLGEDDSADELDFDQIMERLYDWGDTNLDAHWNGAKVCWIDSMTGADKNAKGQAR